MKVWVWQRLYKVRGEDGVIPLMAKSDEFLPDYFINPDVAYWLCPKPNLVLVDRKYLGGME